MNGQSQEMLEQEEVFCYECGCVIEEDDVTHEIEGEIYCESCADECFVTCERCGDYIREDDAEQDSNHTLCQHCYDEYYMRCERCGDIIHRDRVDYDGFDNPYCSYCYDEYVAEEDEDDENIHDYSYKPTPRFFGDGKRFFGVELEIDEGGKSNYNAGEFLYLVNHHDERIYIKSDSSLSCGMEIVTYPMTLHYHQQYMPWAELLDKVQSFDYLSHKTDTCGLHIHVNRSTFGDTQDEQEICISRVLYFVEHHWSEMLKFSRRTAYAMNRWAARYGYKNDPKEILEYAKNGNIGRYACVNISNYNTIEFRMFRGTLKYNSLIAALQLVDAVCDTALFMSDSEISELGWSDFVQSLPLHKYSELITYLKERQLYVNEPLLEVKEDD